MRTTVAMYAIFFFMELIVSVWSLDNSNKRSLSFQVWVNPPTDLYLEIDLLVSINCKVNKMMIAYQ